MTIFKSLFLFLLILIVSVSQAQSTRHFPSGMRDIFIPEVIGVRNNLLQNIAPIVERSINKGLYPGAVIIAAHRGNVIYRGVFGNQRILPNVIPMKANTIFDVASLTKVVVTTTSVMQLVERGKLDLDAPVGHYWPAFNHSGKENVTIRELLTHTSGLPADLTFAKSDHPSKISAIKGVEHQALLHPPGTVFKYSDVNFVALGHLVEIISGESLDDYSKNHIFKPLGMKRTFYLPPFEFKREIAPTEIIEGKLRWGEVHDATAYLMGGVSGMSGLFSDAQDLGIFAQCLLNGGRIPGTEKKYLLGPLTIAKMTTPQTPLYMADIHGLGWDIDSKYSNRGVLFTVNSYGHTGFTGTSMWLDTTTQTWLIILTSRTHPSPAHDNPLIQDRKAIANIVAASITDVPLINLKNTEKGELTRAYKVWLNK